MNNTAESNGADEKELEKIIYILWGPKGQSPVNRRDILLNECGPKLLEKGAIKLSMNIDDPYSTVKSPAPFHMGEPIIAQISIWTDNMNNLPVFEEIISTAGFRYAGYLVIESVYTDYGGNRHAEPRDWPDGERSPGVIAITLLERPKRLPYKEWIRRWHGTQSPVSESMQPRQRYVRNVVVRPVTPDAPGYEGIVEEAWPSPKHITNLYLFYCADNLWQLVKNMTIMLWSVTRCLNLHRIRTTTMSEYFIKT
jgi:hypothetical protein